MPFSFLARYVVGAGTFARYLLNSNSRVVEGKAKSDQFRKSRYCALSISHALVPIKPNAIKSKLSPQPEPAFAYFRMRRYEILSCLDFVLRK